MKQKLGPLPTGLTSTTSFGRGDRLAPLTYQTFFNGDSRRDPKQALVSDHFAVLVHFISRII
jgi:hypothetical protein